MTFMETLKAKAESILGMRGAEGAKALTAVDELIKSQGGIGGLIAKFQQQGYGDIIRSWIGNGANLPLSADQLVQVIGQERINAIAARVGLEPSQLTQKLTTLLPQIVDKLTPNGQMSADSFSLNNLIKAGSEIFKKA